MTPEEELEQHKAVIDLRIKEGIDKLMANGTITRQDFIPNADGDMMIAIDDEAGDTIVYNYTKMKVYSYGGRLNEPGNKG